MHSKWTRSALTAVALGLLIIPAASQDGGLGKKKPTGPSTPPPAGAPGGGGGPRPSVGPAPSKGSGGSGGLSNPPRQTGSQGGLGAPPRQDPPPGRDRDRDQAGDRPPVQIGGDEGLGRRKPSRSGSVDYQGSVNNGARIGGQAGPPSISRLPERIEPQVIRRPESRAGASLETKVRREERVSLSVDGWRVGYYHYDRRWTDDNFWYPHYSFDPFRYQTCHPSPWYYYPTLPAYISPTRVVVINQRPSVGWWGRDYRWSPPDDSWGRGNDIDYAVDDLRRAFQNDDRRAVGRLVPIRGSVHINMDGIYRYSLSADDFYDMLMDATESVRTIQYRILRVRTGRDSAEVLAQHDYRDPWGRRVSTYHTIFLEAERRGGLVIREFGVNDRRW